MSSILSYETSKRLKEAGFPQPTPEVGQVWYDDLNRPVCVRVVFDEYVAFSIFGSLENMSAGNEFVKNHCSFAPTATDILRELGFEFQGYFAAIVNEFVCLQDGAPGVRSWQHENLAEACAMAWLSINEKSETK